MAWPRLTWSNAVAAGADKDRKVTSPLKYDKVARRFQAIRFGLKAAPRAQSRANRAIVQIIQLAANGNALGQRG